MRSLHFRSTLNRSNSAGVRALAWAGVAAVGALVASGLTLAFLMLMVLAGADGALSAEAELVTVAFAWAVFAPAALFVAVIAGLAIDGLRVAHLANLDFANPLATLPRIELRHSTFVVPPAVRPPRLFA